MEIKEKTKWKLNDLYRKYEGTFVTLLAFQYFNQGAKAMLGLAVKDYFKSHLGLEPSQMA